MSEAFLKAVNTSISAGWLVLAVLALRFLLKRAPQWVNVLLWGIVAIRLICPLSIESALSLIPSAETISPDYPALYIDELEYDGTQFVLRTESEVKVYEYLMKYDASGTPLLGETNHKIVSHFVLTHDRNHTWEEIWNSLLSSVLGAAIDHYTICTVEEG